MEKMTCVVCDHVEHDPIGLDTETCLLCGEMLMLEDDNIIDDEDDDQSDDFGLINPETYGDNR